MGTWEMAVEQNATSGQPQYRDAGGLLVNDDHVDAWGKGYDPDGKHQAPQDGEENVSSPGDMPRQPVAHNQHVQRPIPGLLKAVGGVVVRGVNADGVPGPPP